MIKSFVLLAFIICSLSAQNQEFLDNLKLHLPKNIKNQNPIVAVLTCSDSKISPEDVFSKSFGDIFVVRNIGNIVNESVIASIEFAVDILNIPIVVIMGHQNCLAVQGALDVTFKGSKAKPESLNVIYKQIQPSLGNINLSSELKKAVMDNALYQKSQLIKASKLIQNYLRKGKIQCIALYYDINTGNLSEVKP